MPTKKEYQEEIEPNRVMRGFETFTQDHFSSDIQKTLYNRSWKHGEALVEEVEHKHHARRFDTKGRALDRCAVQAGHIHKVNYIVDKSGNFKVECGPPLRKQTVIKDKISSVEYLPIKFYRSANDSYITDDHRHSFKYTGSKEMSPHRMNEAQAIDKMRFEKLYKERNAKLMDGQEGNK